MLIAEELSHVADTGSWQRYDGHGQDHRVAPWTSDCKKLTARGKTIMLALVAPALVSSYRGFGVVSDRGI